jgi:homoaconitase
MVFAGNLTFDPIRDSIGAFKFKPPKATELPVKQFITGDPQYISSPNNKPDSKSIIIIVPHSERLQLLNAFPPITCNEFERLRVLVKVRGKCTTDYISAVGKWLKVGIN